MPSRGRIRRGSLQLLAFPSSHPRGYWTDRDERPGATRSDPARYRRYTTRQLIDRGDIPDTDRLPSGAGDELFQQMDPVFRAGYPELTVRTVHTYLGRRREIKTEAWDAGVEQMRGQLEAAGLTDDEIDDAITEWGDLQDIRIEHDPSGRLRVKGPGEVPLYDGDPNRDMRAAERHAEQRWDASRKLRADMDRTLRAAGKSWSDLGYDRRELDRLSDAPDGSLDTFQQLAGAFDSELAAAIEHQSGLDLEDLDQAVAELDDIDFSF